MHDHNHSVFQGLLEKAQSGDEQAVEYILREFDPLIRKYSYVNGMPDEDLLSELRQAALLCIRRFKCDKDDMENFFREAKDVLANDEL
ncbi:MAG: helix-turn-helix domain-containing protein [Chitinispirillales bacterium]|jgi:hypothetical protein|nr:helix-turn-helix domain-containing protein [Chitinispirillales bacterium]